MEMKHLLLIVFFITAAILSGQSIDYEPFFSVKILDNEETEFQFSNMRYFDANREPKYFFWIRRGSELGTATYQLDFKKIKKIVFQGDYDSPLEGYTPAGMTLTSGEVFDVQVNTSGYIGGIDRDFGVYGEVYMNYNIIQSIEFVHDGTYRQCTFCGAYFYDEEIESCPFDGSELTEQHRISE
ncbi:MAG: hypothetical protein JXR86_04185 [Spirochaetales bacterium]|nr:hypothetical protein [Spirochaetales bacterium]